MSGLILNLAFHTEEPDGVGDKVKILLLPNLSLSASYEAALVARQWDMALYSSPLTMYTKTASILQHQKLVPIVSWEVTVRMLDQQAVFLVILWSPPYKHYAF